jgi:hypothetical protein
VLHTSLSGVFNKAMVKKVGANDFFSEIHAWWFSDTGRESYCWGNTRAELGVEWYIALVVKIKIKQAQQRDQKRWVKCHVTLN